MARKTPETHKAFILHHWDILAALSYKGYLDAERGAVVIAARAGVASQGGAPWEDGNQTVGYVTRQAFLKLELPANIRKDVKRLLARYDPHSEIVVIIYSRAQGTSLYRIASTPTPKAVYAKLGTQLP